jgi:hypothetical protein
MKQSKKRKTNNNKNSLKKYQGYILSQNSNGFFHLCTSIMYKGDPLLTRNSQGVHLRNRSGVSLHSYVE